MKSFWKSLAWWRAAAWIFWAPFSPTLGKQDGDALPGLGVGRIVDEPQERHQVADVLALEELHAARDVVGYPGAGQGDLGLDRDEVRAVEDGDVAEGDPLVLVERADPLHDELGLLAVVHRLDDVGLLHVAARGAQLLVEVPALGLGHQDPVRQVQDLGGRAVVGLDPVDHGPGVALRERHDVLEVRAAPRVDALRVVADGHHAVVPADRVDDLRLEGVRVLVLVDEDVAEPLREVLGDVRRLPKEREPVLEEVVVVADLLLALASGRRPSQTRGAGRRSPRSGGSTSRPWPPR